MAFKLDFSSILSDLANMFVSGVATGIDIGTSGVKVVQLKKAKGAVVFDKFAVVPYPVDDVFGGKGEIANVDAVASTIKEALAAAGIKAPGKVVADIPSTNAVIRLIDLPMMTDEDLEQSIVFEAERYLPYSLAEMSVSYHKVGQFEAEGAPRLKVMIVAAKQEILFGYLESLRLAGIKDPIIDVDAIAVVNALRPILPADEGVAIMDFGAGKTGISIVQDRQIQIVRSVLMGGKSITSAIQNVLGEDWMQAEQAKMERGKIVVDDGEEEDEVAETVRNVVEDIVGDIRRSLEFYQTSTRQHIDSVIITGGSSKIYNLDRFLQMELGVDVMIGNALQGLKIAETIPQEALEDKLPELTCAIGLALREVIS